MSASKPIRIFFSYDHEDEDLRDQLAKHLRLFRRQGLIESWHDREITAGTEWKNQIDANLDAADIILLLVSSDFMDSDYCYDIEMNRAMQRHESGEARVIAIILRPCEWMGATFGKIQALPKDARPVTTWGDKDEAFANIAQSIKKVINELRSSPTTSEESADIHPINKIESLESTPPAPTSPAKWLRGWTLEEKHWPLFLSLLIPLYLLASSDVTDPRFLVLTGITLLVVGILYWVVRLQIKRLWLSGPLGIVGGGLIVAAIMMPICSPIKPPSNKAIQESDKPGLAVTVAKFTYSDSDLKKDADEFNTKLLNQLEIEDAITTIKKYNPKIVDGQNEKINTHVLSEECKCDVFVTGEIQRSKEGDPIAYFKLTNVSSQSASNDGQQVLKPIELKKILVKDQKDYSGLVTLLVGYAYYKWGRWQEAINQLEKLNQSNYKDFHREMYFYKAMSHLQLGLQTQNSEQINNVEQINNAISNFENISKSSPDERDELQVATRLYLALANFFRISLAPQAEAGTEAAAEEATRKATDEIDKVINELADLGKNWVSGNLGSWGSCNLAYTNLFTVLAKKYEITGDAVGLLPQAQYAFDRIDLGCLPEKAHGRLNFGNLLADAARKSDTWDNFDKRLDEAKNNYEGALKYFEDTNLVQDRATTANMLASTLTDRAIYLGDKSGDLERAKKLYEGVLEFLPKEKYPGDWAFTRYNQAFTLIELNNYEDAITACNEAIAFYEGREDAESHSPYWADAMYALGKAKYLKGMKLLDEALLSEARDLILEARALLLKAVAVYDAERRVNAGDTGDEEWAKATKTYGDVCLALIALNQGTARAQNLQCARQSYSQVQLLCNSNNLIIRKLCQEAGASQGLVARN